MGLGNLISGVGVVLYYGLQIFSYILLGRIITSWVGADPRNPLVLLLYRVTEPFLKRIALWFPALRNLGGFDWTPMALFLALVLLQYSIAAPLIRLGARLAAGN